MIAFLFYATMIAQNSGNVTELKTGVRTEIRVEKLKGYIDHLLFRKASVTPTVILKESNAQYQGKIIRKIHVKVLSPFGYDDKDSIKQPNYWERIGNKFHINTRVAQVNNFLQFEKNEPYDTVKIINTENILRNQDYIRRVSISPKFTSVTKDSVDVYLYVLDAWSIGVSASVNSFGGSFSVADYNFMGLGHSARASFVKQGQWGHTYSYEIRNVGKSFIDIGAYNDLDPIGQYQTAFYIRSPFYHNVTRWSSGVLYMNRLYFDEIANVQKEKVFKREIHKQFIDAWLSYILSFKQSDWSAMLSARYQRTDFPPYLAKMEEYDFYYTDKNLMLLSFGVRKMNYKQGHYIFRSGDQELITVGSDVSATMGIQDHLGRRSPYLGLGYSISEFLDNIYLSLSLQWGSYISKNKLVQQTAQVSLLYISQDFKMGLWRLRQFVKWRSVMGWDRKDFQKDRVNLNGKRGIEGFYSPYVFGRHKHLLGLQLRTYSPYQWLGFRLNPLLSTDIAFLGQYDNPFKVSEIYTKFGVGLILKNDYFIFSNIYLSLYLFPQIPGRGKNIMRFNSKNSESFTIERYQYGRPSIVEYQ